MSDKFQFAEISINRDCGGTALDQDIFVDRRNNFYRVVAPHQMDDMDTAEEDCLEKRGFPSFDVHQSCHSDSFCLLPFFTVNGQVQPLIINMKSIQPLRVNLVPLVNILDYDIKREATINIIGNISMFIPTGIIMPILYKRLDCFWKVLFAGAGLSFVIEMIQLLFPGSVTDIDDLILNTAGAAIGYGIYKLVCCFRGKA